jgi:hypothetical protein
MLHSDHQVNLALATAAVTLPSFLLLKEEFTLLREAPDHLTVRGPTVWQLSHSVFFPILCNKIFIILLVQGIIINTIIQNRCNHTLRGLLVP